MSSARTALSASLGLGSTAAQVTRAYIALARHLDTDPAVVPGASASINEDDLRNVTYELLLHNTTLTPLTQFWKAAADLSAGKALTATDTAVLQQILADTPAEPGVPADNQTTMTFALVCGDTSWSRNVQSYAAAAAAAQAKYPLSDGMPDNIWPCAFWSKVPVEPAVKVTASGPRDILLLQNRRDSATPWAGALGFCPILSSACPLDEECTSLHEYGLPEASSAPKDVALHIRRRRASPCQWGRDSCRLEGRRPVARCRFPGLLAGGRGLRSSRGGRWPCSRRLSVDAGDRDYLDDGVAGVGALAVAEGVAGDADVLSRARPDGVGHRGGAVDAASAWVAGRSEDTVVAMRDVGHSADDLVVRGDHRADGGRDQIHAGRQRSCLGQQARGTARAEHDVLVDDLALVDHRCLRLQGRAPSGWLFRGQGGHGRARGDRHHGGGSTRDDCPGELHGSPFV
jgi:hypothetical protein